MPASSGSDFDLFAISKFIELATLNNASALELVCTRDLIAIRDATSPPACPPIPSATATIFDETSPESSFPARSKPRSESANTLNASDICASFLKSWLNRGNYLWR